MRGQILGVDARTGHGLVAGDDGRRYTFEQADWAQRGEPTIGLTVDFETHDSRAMNVFPLPVATAAVLPARALPKSDRNKYVASVLAFFFGMLGIHRFYLGRKFSGAVMLLLTITVLGLLLTAPWSLIDMIRYLMMSDEEFEVRYRRR